MLEIAIDEALLGRLRARFPELEPATVERCLRDVCACAEHLGVRVTASAIERLVDEHLSAARTGRARTGY